MSLRGIRINLRMWKEIRENPSIIRASSHAKFDKPAKKNQESLDMTNESSESKLTNTIMPFVLQNVFSYKFPHKYSRNELDWKIEENIINEISNPICQLLQFFNIFNYTRIGILGNLVRFSAFDNV